MAVYKCDGRKKLDEDGDPECSYEATRKWRGRCPGCGKWYRSTKVGSDAKSKRERATLATLATTKIKPRVKTNMPEVDRVLNGGIPEGSTIIISGEPGIGKSTLLFQLADSTAVGSKRVSYYAGEQNQNDIAEYAQRLGIRNPNVLVNADQQALDITEIIREAEEDKPVLIILDSLQTTIHPGSKGDAGSAEQCRVVTGELTEWAKKKGVAVVMVSHVNKEGDLAGPKAAEHLVDGTLEFDPAMEMDDDGIPKENTKSWRRLSSGAKFRLGESHVSALFKMTNEGLEPVKTKSNLLSLVRDDD